MRSWFLFKQSLDQGDYKKAKHIFQHELIKNTGYEKVELGKNQVFAFEIPLMAYILLRKSGIDLKEYECLLKKIYEIHRNLLPESREKYYNIKLSGEGVHMYPIEKIKFIEKDGELHTEFL